jgi:Domain of unknown function (DUF4177)
MTTFEYKVVELQVGAHPRDVQDQLNALGPHGWELVSVTVNSAGWKWLWLKRPANKEIYPGDG